MKRLALAAGVALVCAAPAMAESVAIHTPEGFQVLGLSPNGKWACGVYLDAMQTAFGFRWNLESGTVEMLGSKSCTAWDVANDGTVSGDFGDTQALETGASISLPGFWRDGYWHHLEMPEGTPTDGMGTGISPDGHYMTGAVETGGVYRSYIWKDGRIHAALPHNDHAVMSAVAPDGSGATGWVMMRNRAACYWNINAGVTPFIDSPEFSYSPWNYGRNFSPDGTKILYWGGWEVEGDDVYLYSVCDLATGEHKRVKAPAYESDLEFFDISNNGMLVGFDRGRGYVWTGTEGMYIDDYLAARGVDLSSFADFYSGSEGYSGILPIYRVVAVSEDENVLAMQYYNTRGQVCSLVVKADQDLSAVSPAQVSAAQLSGLGTVAVRWHRPVGANVRGYNVYRDGRKVSGMLPLTVPYFYDKNLAPGTYTYEVSAVSTSGIETRAEAVHAEVAASLPEAPYALYARHRGVNGAHLSWTAPMASGVHKRYYDPSAFDFTGFSIYEPVSVEMAVAFDRAEIAQYAGQRISAVSFMPMGEQRSWKVNIYSRAADGTLSLVASRPVDASTLVYGQLNTVTFDTPVDLPQGDLLVAVEVEVASESYNVLGAESGRVQSGYTDLLRLTSEPEFYSAFESSAASGMTITCLSWAIDVTLSGDGAEAPALKGYRVWIDGEDVGTTDACTYIAEGLSDGTHTLAVEAEYADGTVSDRVETGLTMKATCTPIAAVKVDAGTGGATAVTASWSVPADNDLTTISYTRAATHGGGLTGVESNGYALMAAHEYSPRMLRGYGGYRIEALRFYPLADAIFTFMLYQDDDLVAEYEVPEFTLGCWNEVALPESVTVKEGSTYRLVVDCFDPEPGVPLLAIDRGMPSEYLSDLYSTDNGLTWNSATIEAAARGSWMLGMVISDGSTAPLPIDGYDVVVDGRVSNGSRLHDTVYTHDFGKWDDAEHTLRVDAYYAGRTEAVEGETATFRLSVSGITDAAVAGVTLQRDRGLLRAIGEGVQRIELYTASGALATAADGDCADISALAPGVYMAKVVTAAGTCACKLSIND